jgi:hypothetical protein
MRLSEIANSSSDFSGQKRPKSAASSTIIWRYVAVPDFLNLMNDQCLGFHQFKELQDSDAHEGMVVPGFWESVQSHFDGESIKALQESGEGNLYRLRHFYYASCWNMSDGENALMWKAYAPKGVAIKTSVGKLMSAKLTAPNATIGQSTIEYADHWSELEARGYVHDQMPLNWLFLHAKRKAFTSETEVRFHVQPPAKFIQRAGSPISANPDDCSPWCLVTFETLDWIDQVVTAPSTSNWDAKPIKRLAEEGNLDFAQSGI